MRFNFEIKHVYYFHGKYLRSKKTLHNHSADSEVSDNVLQAETEGLKSVVYKTLISPHKNDMPAGNLEGFKRVCDSRHKYAFMASLFVGQYWAMKLPCHFTTLPDTFYPECLTFVISKNSPYKKLINWKWVFWVWIILFLSIRPVAMDHHFDYCPFICTYIRNTLVKLSIAYRWSSFRRLHNIVMQ